MKKLLIILCMILLSSSACFAFENNGLRDYDGIEISKGTFLPVISAQEISTAYCDIGTVVKFISTTDLYLYDSNVIPKNTEFYGYVEKINEPVVGTNASMVIKVNKLKFLDGFTLPVNGYIYSTGGTLIGGEMTAPAVYDQKLSFRQGYYGMLGYVPGAERRMGSHTVIASGADLMVVLSAPLYITHTVNN